MAEVLTNVLIAILAAMLIVATVGDIRTRTIPNWLNAGIALGAVPFWILSGLGPVDMLAHLGVAIGVFLIFALAFYLGAMGGGDVKMVAAIALWLPIAAVAKLLVIMSLAGGVLTLAMLVRHKLAKCAKQLEIPYGVAIAFGGFWVIGERFLNQFG